MYPYFVAVDAGGGMSSSTTPTVQSERFRSTARSPPLLAPEHWVTQATAGGDRRKLNNPLSIAIGGANNLFIAEGGSQHDLTGRIRKVSPNGTIGTVYTGLVTAGAADSGGDLYIAGAMGAASAFYELSAAGVLSTIAITDSLSAIVSKSAPQFDLFNPVDGSFDGAGNFYFTSGGTVLKISPAGIITNVPGNGSIYPDNITADMV